VDGVELQRSPRERDCGLGPLIEQLLQRRRAGSGPRRRRGRPTSQDGRVCPSWTDRIARARGTGRPTSRPSGD
jgi:hypothetical protein